MAAFDSKNFARQNWLRCINPQCGHETALLSERTFKCPECDNVYDVIHSTPHIDFHQVQRRFIPGTGEFFQVQGSGVWAWQEFILPGVPHDQLVTLGERVVIVRVHGNLAEWIGGDLELYMALEGITPTGAFKDIGMPVAITTAKLSGAPLVICASTGDTSAAAAAYAAAAGIECVVFLPKGKVTAAQLVQPLAFGATIIEVNGNFDDCMRIVGELVEQHGAFPVNSLNPARIEGHQATVFNASMQLGRLPDWFVLPLGNGSNTSSVGKGQRALVEYFKLAGTTLPTGRILAVQPENAAPLALSFHRAQGHTNRVVPSEFTWHQFYEPVEAGETIATATRIGRPVSFAKVIREITHHSGMVVSVNDEQARGAMFAAGASGYQVCPQTGLALYGLKQAVRNGRVKSRSQVVVISTAHGLKFSDAFLPQDDEPFAVSLDTATTSEAAKLLNLS